MTRSLPAHFFAVLALTVVATANAQHLPPVNLGQSSFLDAGPIPSGLFLQEVADYYTTDALVDGDGEEAPCDFELGVFVLMNPLSYISDKHRLFGARIGFELLMPVVFPDLDPGDSPLRNATTGAGDLIIGGILQWDPIKRANGEPLFVNRFNLVGSIPTGNYSRRKDLNPGNNFTTFNPYWAATFTPWRRWELSWRLLYLWCGENDEPNVRAFPGARTTQAGQAFHANFGASYAVTPRVRIGINGYYLGQFTYAEIDGREIPNSKEQVLALGPGAWFAVAPKTLLIAGIFFENNVENRLEGDRFVLRIIHNF